MQILIKLYSIYVILVTVLQLNILRNWCNRKKEFSVVSLEINRLSIQLKREIRRNW